MRQALIAMAICISMLSCAPIPDRDIESGSRVKIEKTLEMADTKGDVEIIPKRPIRYGFIKGLHVNVRQAPDTKSKIISQLEKGDRVIIEEKIKDWYRVQIEDSVSAYIYGSLLAENEYFSYEPPLGLKFGMTIGKVRAVLSQNDYSVEKTIGNSSPNEYYIFPLISLYNYDKWLTNVYFDEYNIILNLVCINRLNYFREDSTYTHSEFIMSELIKTYGVHQKEEIIDEGDSARVLLFKAEDNSIVLYVEYYTSSSGLDKETYEVINYIYINIYVYYCSPDLAKSFLKSKNYNLTIE